MNKRNKLISIVIPVYNVEKYLDECIKSVINQTYQNLEIILVNDGSTDKSKEICEKWQKEDKRIVVINKKNSGAADARNVGIKNASGDYLSFIDSDDYIEKDMYKILVDDIEKNDVDMSVCNCKYLYQNRIIEYKKNRVKRKLDIEEILYEMNRPNSIGNGPWAKLYRKELFNDIIFPIGKKHEDIFIMYKIYSKCKNGAIYDSIEKYYYRQRKSSQSKSKEITYEPLIAQGQCEKFINNNYPNIKDSGLSGTINGCLDVYNKLQYMNNKKIEKKCIRKIVCKKFFKVKNKKDFFSLKKQMQIYLLIFSEKMYKTIYEKTKKKTKLIFFE